MAGLKWLAVSASRARRDEAVADRRGLFRQRARAQRPCFAGVFCETESARAASVPRSRKSSATSASESAPKRTRSARERMVGKSASPCALSKMK